MAADIAQNTTTSEQKFKYNELADPRKETRLLELSPGSVNDTIDITLKHVDISEAGDYESLSYT